MAPRTYWKRYLNLSLVSCPIALYSASSEGETISFHQPNKNTGNRIKYRKADADTGEQVDSNDIIEGYEVGKGEYIEVNPEELEAIALESKRAIEIDDSVPRDQIDVLYLNNSYFILPGGEVGTDAFAVFREAINKEGMVAWESRVHLARAHHCARWAYVAISLQGEEGKRGFRRPSRRQDHQGYAGLATHIIGRVRP